MTSRAKNKTIANSTFRNYALGLAGSGRFSFWPMKIQLENDISFELDDEDFVAHCGSGLHLHNTGERQYVAVGKRHKLLHRVIVQAKPGDIVDHKNGNPLDNRRENLRICTASQNCANAKKRSHSKQPFKGVYAHRDKWKARITVSKKRIFLGTFYNAETAAVAYDLAAKEHFGEFARVNFP